MLKPQSPFNGRLASALLGRELLRQRRPLVDTSAKSHEMSKRRREGKEEEEDGAALSSSSSLLALPSPASAALMCFPKPRTRSVHTETHSA